MLLVRLYRERKRQRKIFGYRQSPSVILNLVLKKKKKACTGNITYNIEIDSIGQNSLIK